MYWVLQLDDSREQEKNYTRLRENEPDNLNKYQDFMAKYERLGLSKISSMTIKVHIVFNGLVK